MNDEQKSGSLGWSIVSWIAFFLILGVAAAVLVPGLLSSGRAQNDTRSATILKVLACAEADFRANDRDWNHVNDFWTGDVKGLYTMTSSAVPGAAGDSTDPPIKLISLAMAASDLDDALVEAGGENMPLESLAVPSPYRGYWQAALIEDLSDPKDPMYKQETGDTPPMGRCHHLSKFGFVAIPDSQSAGPYVYMVNEANTVYRSSSSRMDVPSTTLTTSRPLRLSGVSPVFLKWPDEKNLKLWWSKED